MSLVLITGSRKCSPAMAAKTREIVRWLVDHGHSLIVGDACGVDQQAIYEIIRLGQSSRMEVCSGHSRRITFPGDHVSTVLEKGNLYRNRYMVNKCDLCLAIWDGRSKGTRYTFEYAQTQSKRVVVRKFPDQSIQQKQSL